MKSIMNLFHRVRGALNTSAAALMALPSVAMAALPQQESITEGADGDLFGTIQGVGQEGFSLGFIALAAFAILVYIVGLIWAFNESKKRGEWSVLGAVLGFGVLMIVVVIWLANYGDPIMGG
ncbi:DUF2976 domain-containing protein [uncultured Kushneria sp.]|uniref:DUF2976 domain-containing protein n=1 Tax=uncultured Kushneria sp. TaxID=905033 RepID=UPI0004E621E2|nr:DUF2976 domain-containing protein [uncultured Kushneria sp.]KFF48760.1 hypothetical protein GY26_12160 [Gammaproteobacteria bacterium MFB021]